MRPCMECRWWVVATGWMWLSVGTLWTSAQTTAMVKPQATAEDALAAVVHQSAVIFAGEVYAIRLPQGAIRLPQGMSGAGNSAGLASARPDVVEVEFRVDMGILGTSIGNNYILHMPASGWAASSPPFTVHQRSVTFLLPPDAAGLSGPVQSEADLPGMDVGVMLVDKANQVDLSRLERLVMKKTLTSVPAPTSAPLPPPSVTDVTTSVGEDTLISGSGGSGSNAGRMPELRNNTVPFLALVRDVTVLSAAENAAGSSATATK